MRSSRPQKASVSALRFNDGLGRDSLVEKASSWNGCKVTALHSFTPVELFSNERSHPERFCELIQVVSSRCSRPSTLTFNSSETSNPPCSEAKVSSLRRF